MNAFWNRIQPDPCAGTIFDGDRRYLMMRPDVLMGMFRALPLAARSAALTALAESARKQGGQSVSAYRQAGGHAQLQQTVIDGAATFGWGSWRISNDGDQTQLEVANSPFVAGYGQSEMPVCAPINGIFHSLAQILMDADVVVVETHCAAQHGGHCRFEARRSEPASQTSGA